MFMACGPVGTPNSLIEIEIVSKTNETSSTEQCQPGKFFRYFALGLRGHSLRD